MLVYIFNFDLFEFSAAILEEGSIIEPRVPVKGTVFFAKNAVSKIKTEIRERRVINNPRI